MKNTSFTCSLVHFMVPPVFTKSSTLGKILKHKKSLSSYLCITYFLPTKHGMTIHWHRYQDIQLHCTCVLVTQYQQKLIYFQYCKREVLQNHLCMSQLRLGSHNFDHCFSDSLRHLPHYEEYLHRKHHLSVSGHHLCSNFICFISWIQNKIDKTRIRQKSGLTYITTFDQYKGSEVFKYSEIFSPL